MVMSKSRRSNTRSGIVTLPGISRVPMTSITSMFSNRSSARRPTGQFHRIVFILECSACPSFDQRVHQHAINSTYPSASTRSGRSRKTGPTRLGSFRTGNRRSTACWFLYSSRTRSADHSSATVNVVTTTKQMALFLR